MPGGGGGGGGGGGMMATMQLSQCIQGVVEMCATVVYRVNVEGQSARGG